MADELAERFLHLEIEGDAPPPYSASASAATDVPSIATPAQLPTCVLPRSAGRATDAPSVAPTVQPPRNVPATGGRRGRSKRGYVVFVGKRSGVYTTWTACNAQVFRVSHSFHQSYPTVAEARAAFEVARAYGLTFSCGEGAIAVDGQTSATRVSPSDLVLCLAFLDDPASITIAPADNVWHVVYKGVQPGVYRSYVEVGIITTGLADAHFCSFDTREEAVESFTSALERGEVYRLSRG